MAVDIEVLIKARDQLSSAIKTAEGNVKTSTRNMSESTKMVGAAVDELQKNSV